jgi:hypothetical protein
MIHERSRKQVVEKDFQKYMYHPFLQCEINASSEVMKMLGTRNRGSNSYKPRHSVKSVIDKEPGRS